MPSLSHSPSRPSAWARPCFFLPLYLRSYASGTLDGGDLPFILMLVIAAAFGLALLLRGLRQLLAWRRAKTVRHGVWLLPAALLIHLGPGMVHRIPKTALERVSLRRATAPGSPIPVDSLDIHWRDDTGRSRHVELSIARLEQSNAPQLIEAFRTWAGDRFQDAATSESAPIR